MNPLVSVISILCNLKKFPRRLCLYLPLSEIEKACVFLCVHCSLHNLFYAVVSDHARLLRRAKQVLLISFHPYQKMVGDLSNIKASYLSVKTSAIISVMQKFRN